MFCSSCGQPRAGEAPYCHGCGHRFPGPDQADQDFATQPLGPQAFAHHEAGSSSFPPPQVRRGRTLVAPDLVATVAHVVDGAVSVVLRQGATTTRWPMSYPTSNTCPVSGVAARTSATSPGKGSISGQDRSIDTESGHHIGLLQTHTAINPGNSGGPLLGMDGDVYGLVQAKRTDAASMGFAVPTAQAGTELAGWEAAPITDHSESADGPAIAQAFSTYATGINTGDYASAYAVLSPRAQRLTSASAFARGEASSYLVALDVTSASPNGGGSASAEVMFTACRPRPWAAPARAARTGR